MAGKATEKSKQRLQAVQERDS